MRRLNIINSNMRLYKKKIDKLKTYLEAIDMKKMFITILS